MKRKYLFSIMFLLFLLLFLNLAVSTAAPVSVPDPRLIKLYGRLVNEDNLPIPSCRIDIWVRMVDGRNGLPISGTMKRIRTIKTDLSGNFVDFIWIPADYFRSGNYLILRDTPQLLRNSVFYRICKGVRLDSSKNEYEVYPRGILQSMSGIINVYPFALTGKVFADLEGALLGIPGVEINISVLNYRYESEDDYNNLPNLITFSDNDGRFGIFGCVPDIDSILKVEAEIGRYTSVKYIRLERIGLTGNTFYMPAFSIELNNVDPRDFLEPSDNVLDTDRDGVPDRTDTDDDNDGLLDSEDPNPLDISTPDSLTRLPGTIVTASSYYIYPDNPERAHPREAIDGVIGVISWDEWAAPEVTPWIQITFPHEVEISRIILYDRANAEQITSGYLTFSDGYRYPGSGSFGPLNNDGSATEFNVGRRNITWVRFQATSSVGPNPGLSEFEVYTR